MTTSKPGNRTGRRPVRALTYDIVQFNRELAQLHQLTGAPDQQELATRISRPVSVFGFLDEDQRLLPPWEQVSALLVALRHPNTKIAKIQTTHEQLLARQRSGHRTTARAPLGPIRPAPTVRLDPEIANTALQKATAAVSAADFAAALTTLQQGTRVRHAGKDRPLSFKGIEDVSGKKLTKSVANRMATGPGLPASAANVMTYIRACGVAKEIVPLWVAVYRRLQRGEQPPAGLHSAGATTEDHEPRAGGVLAGLASTDDFTTSTLGQAARKLILFVTIAIADSTGSPSSTYDNLLRRYAKSDGHWAQRLTELALREHLQRYIGRNARKVPLWTMTQDLISSAFSNADDRQRALATAAALFAEVTQQMPPGYAGNLSLPWWGNEQVRKVTVQIVRHSLPGPQPQLSDAEREILALKEENALFRVALQTSSRAFHSVNTELEAKRATEATLRRELAESRRELEEARRELEKATPKVWNRVVTTIPAQPALTAWKAV